MKQNRRRLLTSLGAGLGMASAPVSALGRQIGDSRALGTSRVPRLKIKEVRAVELRSFGSRFVRVYTDQGLTGTGEMVDNVGSAQIINEKMGPAIAGRDPLDIEAIYFHFWGWGQVPGTTWPVFMRGSGGGPYLSALSGIEIALWDLAGKALGAPVYRLLGGKVRDRIAVYFWGPGDDAETMIRQHGIRAFKMGIDVGVTERGDPSWRLDPGKRSHWTVTNREIDAIVRSVQNARERVGPDVELGVECHTRYNTESAIQIGRAVAPFRPMWLEEPIPSDNLDAMALVRRSIPVPVACGENIYTRYGYRQVMEKQAAAIIQPDMTKCGGLLETRKIASLAEIYHVDLAPHGTASPLAGMAYAHVCATVPNFLILEFGHLLRQQSAPLRALLRNQPRYEKGFVHIPEAPGIGIEVNDDAIRENLAPGFRWS
ncbi:MAG: mandelate racemase/muconate lactonizing enzyme family protein [Bryobacterales bacterium]|nr:mandelate racemase/muconate lactonizing enzyme family protein [Bryobacterales bacterium]